MGTRLQELLQRLNTTHTTAEVGAYLSTYVTKSKNSTTDFCTLTHDCLVCKQNKHCKQTASSSAATFGGLKGGFLSSEPKKHSTEAQSSTDNKSERTVPKHPPRFTGNPLYSDEECLWSDRGPANSTKEKILFGLEFSDATFHVAEDSNERIMYLVAEQLEHLLATEGSNRPPIPTNRPPVFTDIVYLTRSEFGYLYRLYSKMSEKLSDLGYEKTALLVQQNHKLTILSLYMYEYLYMFRNGYSKPDEIKREIQAIVIQGYKALLKDLRDHDHDYQGTVEYLSSYPGFLAVNQLGEVINNSEKHVLVVMIKAIVQYQDLLRNDVNKFSSVFCFHPIFNSIAMGFGIIDRAARKCESK